MNGPSRAPELPQRKPALRNRGRRGSRWKVDGATSSAVAACPVPVLVAATPGGLDIAVELAGPRASSVLLGPVAALVPPWTRTLAYGAVAWDGTLIVDDALIDSLDLSPSEVRAEIARQSIAAEDVAARFASRTKADNWAMVGGHSVIVVDDGDAPLAVLRTAVAVARNARATWVTVATGGASAHDRRRLATFADSVYSPDQRSHWRLPPIDDLATQPTHFCLCARHTGVEKQHRWVAAH